jgi:WD40 repeat protein
MSVKKLFAHFIGNIGLCTVMLSTVGCAGNQDAPKSAPKTATQKVAATRLVATIADDVKPPEPIPGHDADPVTQGKSASFEIKFSESGSGVAYVAGKGESFFVVFNQSRGKVYPAVGTIVLSPDGRRIAYGAGVDGKWCMVVDGKEQGRYDTVLTPIFSPDGRHLVFQAKIGVKWYIVMDGVQNQGTLASYTTPVFSADSSSLAYVEAAASNSNMRLIVTNIVFSRQSEKLSIGDLLFTTNRGRTKIAAAQVVDGKFRIIDFNFANPDTVHEGKLYDLIERLTLSSDGVSVCYCALLGRNRLIVLDGKEEELPEGRLPDQPVIRPDHKGVGAIMLAKNRYFLHQSFEATKEPVKSYDEAANLSYGTDGSYAYAARNGKSWFVVVNGIEGPVYDRVVDPIFSPDGKYLVYRARRDGKRFVVTADGKNGTVIKEHTSFEQVLDVTFTPDGRSIAYGVKAGQKLIWKVDHI